MPRNHSTGSKSSSLMAKWSSPQAMLSSRAPTMPMSHFLLLVILSGMFAIYYLVSHYVSNEIRRPSATTHTDLIIRARELGIQVKTIHNASIMNAIGACGLQLYNFGQTISIVFFTDPWRPDSFYDKVKE